MTQSSNITVPSDVLISKTINKSVGQTELGIESFSFIFYSLLVGFSFCQFSFQVINMFIDLSYFLNDNFKLFSLSISGGLGFICGVLQWLDLLEDSIVIDNVYNP